MKKPISRRRFIKQATAVGGASLLGSTAQEAQAMPNATQNKPAKQAKTATLDYEEIVRLPVYKAQIEPHWFAEGKRFWYRNLLAGGRREFLLVDAVSGQRSPAFDHAGVANGLTKASGTPHQADRLPFDTISFTDDQKSIRFTADGKDWECDLASCVCTPLPKSPLPEPPTPKLDTAVNSGLPAPEGALRSPNGRWYAFIKEHNVVLRTAGTGNEKALTTTGTAERPFDKLRWSPDSHTLVAFRTRPVTINPVFLIESSPKDGGTRGVLRQHEYAQPGDPFPIYEPWVFSPETGVGKAVVADAIDFGEEPPDLTWRSDGTGFFYEQVERGHQRFRIIAVDARTGQSKTIVDERSATFIHTSHSYTHYTRNTDQVFYVSEQDGWRHLYRYDTETGQLKNQVTAGEWVVRAIDHIDEERQEIWFQASGKNHGENPYHLHFYRIRFDGSGLVALTEGNGTHSVQYSPDRTYLIDTFSRADLPPVHTLRRTSDSGLICPLETADITALTAAGWRPPEIFSATGRDGHTDIWGLVFRPFAFDPQKRYPVIENIYAGPHDSFVRQRFSTGDGMQSLAELGFIVVQCDGMGTRNRSKAFHDVCWRNIKDAGLPDRIAWIKALAARYPAVDATRVGIYGTSAGGQSSTGALLFHPEFYKVAVSSCGCHDNRVDKRWWNEQWMGYPIGPWYADNSNITHAANLRGKLLLLVGELDTNVPPESTLRLADALMKADKDFELLVLTGLDHTGGGTYGERRRRDFFVRHLLGVEPPDRNAPKPPVRPVRLKSRLLGEISLAQSSGGGDTTIVFRNLSPDEIQVFWLPGDGRQVLYGTIEPGKTRLQHTYSGHYWLVTTKDGKPLALFVGESKPGIAEIGNR